MERRNLSERIEEGSAALREVWENYEVGNEVGYEVDHEVDLEVGDEVNDNGGPGLSRCSSITAVSESNERLSISSTVCDLDFDFGFDPSSSSSATSDASDSQSVLLALEEFLLEDLTNNFIFDEAHERSPVHFPAPDFQPATDFINSDADFSSPDSAVRAAFPTPVVQSATNFINLGLDTNSFLAASRAARQSRRQLAQLPGQFPAPGIQASTNFINSLPSAPHSGPHWDSSTNVVIQLNSQPRPRRRLSTLLNNIRVTTSTIFHPTRSSNNAHSVSISNNVQVTTTSNNNVQVSVQVSIMPGQANNPGPALREPFRSLVRAFRAVFRVGNSSRAAPLPPPPTGNRLGVTSAEALGYVRQLQARRRQLMDDVENLDMQMEFWLRELGELEN